MSERRTILAIDPGNVQSAWLLYDPASHRVREKAIVSNAMLLAMLRLSDEMLPGPNGTLAIEMIASYGMAVGKTIFETCVWIGKFVEAWENRGGVSSFVYRRDVKLHLCMNCRAKDSNVRQAIIDLFPASGVGAIPQIGTKKAPGPLYGISKDLWAALGVALTISAGQAEKAGR